MKKKKSILDLVAMNMYWFGLSFMWNSLHPIVLPAILLNFVPESNKNTYLGLLTFLGLVLAMIVQPISGALSDSSKHKWGKRRPYVVFGTLVDLLFLSLLAWSGNLLWIFVGYIGLQISSNIAHGPMQGLMPDLIPEEQLGIGSGIKNLLDMAGLVVASLTAGILLQPQNPDPFNIMMVVITILLVTAVISIFTTHEKQVLNGNEDAKASPSLKQILSIDLKKHKKFGQMLAARFMYLLGVYGIQTFAQYYIRDVMAVPNPVKATGDLMVALALALIACALIAGWLSDKIGPLMVMNVATILTALGAILLVFAPTIDVLTIFAGIVGAGIGLYITSNWALATKLAPSEQAGKFLGFTNIATAGASAVGRLEGPLIDFMNSLAPGDFWGYRGVFIFCSICALMSMYLATKYFRKNSTAKQN